MHVRFEMANNIALARHMLNQPGDSIVVDIAPTREGSQRYGDYLIHYTIDANPVFDPYRVAPIAGVVLAIATTSLMIRTLGDCAAATAVVIDSAQSQSDIDTTNND